jgi:chemotaxis protein histidine kinase CheA
MELIDDPEIIEDFCKEAAGLFDELEEILENLEEEIEEDSSGAEELEKFGQIIDRVMGSAQTIGAEEISRFCELGKVIGYKSSQTTDLPLLNVVVAILFDAVDLLRGMVTSLQSGNSKTLNGLSTKAFATRLKWLSNKFQNIDRASVESDVKYKDNKKMSQSSIDDLMASLGL